MAERERLTNKDRRAQAREERRLKEAAAAKRRQQRQIRSSAITVVVVLVVGAVLYQAFAGGTPTLDDAILISSSDAADAREAAGCELLTQATPLGTSNHLDVAPANLDSVYTDTRPTHSGPHTPALHPVGEFSRQIDEFNSTHNLEHGAVIVWYDPSVDGVSQSDIERWARTLNANGFSSPQLARAGAGVITSQYTDPGIAGGRGVALRAWGTALDCVTWDETVANAFVIDNFGTHGIAPERMFAPYPTTVLAYADLEVDDTPVEEAPVDGQTPLEDMPIDGEAPEDGDGDDAPEDGDEDADAGN